MHEATPKHAAPPVLSHDLSGKRVVVVGGKTGMGLGVALAAHAAGGAVTVASRRHTSVEERPELAAFDQVSLDVRDEASVREGFEAVGTLDHLVVTAAPDLGTQGKFMDADMRGARAYMDGKFFGSYACARHAAPRLAAGGSITFVTGGTGARPKLGFATVTPVLAAVEALSGSLALELSPLRVNTIRPGFVDTEMWAFLPEAERDAVRTRVRDTFPARRVGTPGDIGHAALFLMTNPYVTGTVLEVSGGELLVDWFF